jgi:glycosyltransferase involved in cell wall biosynthesis
MAKQVLFLVSTSCEQASTRYRVLQYIPALHAAGFSATVSPFLSPEQERRLYDTGISPQKALDILVAGFKRLGTALRARSFDFVVIGREAMLYGPPFLEWWIRRIFRLPIIFDYDDAVYIPYVSPTYGKAVQWIKCPWKIDRIIRMSAHVLAASPLLVEHARELNACVTFMPTVVDVRQYQDVQPWPRPDTKPVIGWIGSHSTAQYLKLVAPAMQEAARRYSFVFRVIGAREKIEIPGVDVENRAWVLADEIRNFRSLDIGLYPLFDDAWARGKAAFKAIQYLAAGVPCVSSYVGMTRDIIQHGVTGLIARDTEEWVANIEALLKDSSLGKRLAVSGLEHIRRQYSLDAHAPRMVEVFRKVAGTQLPHN